LESAVNSDKILQPVREVRTNITAIIFFMKFPVSFRECLLSYLRYVNIRYFSIPEKIIFLQNKMADLFSYGPRNFREFVKTNHVAILYTVIIHLVILIVMVLVKVDGLKQDRELGVMLDFTEEKTRGGDAE
jgi:hypothetical protein